MKTFLAFTVFLVCAAVPLHANPHPNERLAGKYLSMVPGSTWTLSLGSSGAYSLTTQGSFERSARLIESGTWLLEEFTLVLRSEQAPVDGTGGEYRKLNVLRKKKSGELILVSALRVESYIGLPFGSDTLFDFVFVPAETVEAQMKKEANQASEPTPSGRGSP